MWKYVILFRDSNNDVTFKAVGYREQVTGANRAAVIESLCRDYNLDSNLVMGVLEATPDVEVTLSKCGSMFRFSK
jgi:hypothetical protein